MIALMVYNTNCTSKLIRTTITSSSPKHLIWKVIRPIYYRQALTVTNVQRNRSNYTYYGGLQSVFIGEFTTKVYLHITSITRPANHVSQTISMSYDLLITFNPWLAFDSDCCLSGLRRPFIRAMLIHIINMDISDSAWVTTNYINLKWCFAWYKWRIYGATVIFKFNFLAYIFHFSIKFLVESFDPRNCLRFFNCTWQQILSLTILIIIK